MHFTADERAVLAALRRDPLQSHEQLAALTGLTPDALSRVTASLIRAGELRGHGWLLREPDPIVVVGGAVLDRKVQTDGPLVLGSSNPGRSTWAAGGVGRNIAETLARLGRGVELVAPVGNDPAGTDIVSACRAAGVGVGHLLPSASPTGVYVAVLDEVGELVVGLSDMWATDSLTVRSVSVRRDIIGSAELLVIDGNIPAAVVGWLLDFAAASRISVLVEPVSVNKARQVATALDPARPILALTPNIDELGAMLGRDIDNTPAAIGEAAGWFHDQGVENLWVRRGPEGSVLCIRPHDGGPDQVHLLPAPPAQVVDVTGAGDAMAAGFIHAWLDDGDAYRAAAVGQVVAALTVEVSETVRTDLTPALVAERLAQQEPR